MLKKPKILVVGSLVMDLIATTGRAPASGETVIGRTFRTAPGGKGANQAVQCARLGAEVTLVGQVGDDCFGRELLEATHAAGVDVSHVSRDSACASGVGHILVEVTDRGAQNRITVVPGANFTMQPKQLAWLETAIGAYDMLLLQLELPTDVVCAAADYARRAGVPVMLNPAPAAPLPAGLQVTYLSPNEQEAATLTGLPLLRTADGIRQEDVARAAEALKQLGTEYVLLTLGADGAVFRDSGGLHRIPCVNMPHVADPTGAGDSFVAAFCTGVAGGLSHLEATTLAAHAAALTVSRVGAMPSLPTRTEVGELLRLRGVDGVL
ncbi:MAG: ribokinase [Oscillospiraceae bacterium]